MPERIVNDLMQKYRVAKPSAEKAIAIASNMKTGKGKLLKKSESILHQIQAGYYSGKKKSKSSV